MRLSQDKARRLSALVWRDRARRWLPVAAGVLAMAGVLVFLLGRQMARVDSTLEVHERDGTVTALKSGGSARGAAVLAVHLDDGRDVEAVSALRIALPKGAHVVVAEARHASGRVTFDVMRLLEH